MSKSVIRSLSKNSHASRSPTRNTVTAALRASQARYEMLLEESVEAIYMYDSDSKRILEANPAFLNLLGYNADEVRCLTIYDIIAHDKEDVDRYLGQIMSSGRIVIGDRRWRRKDGTFVSVDVNVSKFRQGRRDIVFVIARDIGERKRLEHETRQRANEFAVMYETTRDLAAQPDLPSLLNTIVERTIKLLGAPSGFIYLYDGARRDLELKLTMGVALPRRLRIQIGEGIAGRVMQTRQPFNLKDYQTWEYRLPQYASAGYRAILEVPMTFRDDLIGVLGVNEINESNRQFTESDVRILCLFAAQASIAVHNTRMYEQVIASRASLQALSQRVIRAQELERREIARELHDEIGQALTGVQLNLQRVHPSLDEDDRECLVDCMRTIEHVLHQARDLSLNLRPSVLDDFGLLAALKWLVKRRAQALGPIIELTADPFETRLSGDVETACFRVAQEALTNIIRHASASRVSIDLRLRDKQVQLFIQEDGVGFDVSKAIDAARGGESLGLLGIKERVLLIGGRIEIESAEGKGTTIRAYFPVRPKRAFVERRAHRRVQK